MSEARVPDRLPPSMPQFPQHAGRHLARWVLRTAGWRLAGEIPQMEGIAGRMDALIQMARANLPE